MSGRTSGIRRTRERLVRSRGQSAQFGRIARRRHEPATTYRYNKPVEFSPHRVMFRPRAAHDIRVLSATLAVSPHSTKYWMQNVFSNSVAIVEPQVSADALDLRARFVIEHSGVRNLELPVAPEAGNYAFQYNDEDRLDLAPFLLRNIQRISQFPQTGPLNYYSQCSTRTYTTAKCETVHCALRPRTARKRAGRRRSLVSTRNETAGFSVDAHKNLQAPYVVRLALCGHHLAWACFRG
ncbi:hypothetical protein PPGU19_050150 [Paraburkholderia sp. PGU19]|uniref:transglutaminase N-terminal domain-containing protein n=1 Tax=Paraburkholderia sp. PGU19 TaxID=2735434 RepID=UPI0015D97B28|nr:transglutaminase N-terminal domain-containing protein [Paraburkholderia sp. PGU19]BCG00447.1 hypothetical protein PPGU19_050150 [Paraburkholderia sp. PGU19]